MRQDLEESIAILERTPRVLSVLLEGLGPQWTDRDYGPATWTAQQVVGHLIWGERTDWMPRVRHVLRFGETRPFEPFDRSGHLPLCRERTLDDLLDLFADERRASLASLRELRLSRADFERSGMHPALGRVTLAQLIATWAVHDLNHIAQVCKALAFQYAAEVGPWEAYLSILAPPNPR